MRPLVFGINGKIGAGKDAIADHLVKRYGFVVVRFSDALKHELQITIPRTLRQVYRQLYQGAEPDDYAIRRMLWVSKPPIVRQLLQEWGTELRRTQDPDYWVTKWRDHAMLYWGAPGIVAPDMRFLNEMIAVRELGGYAIRVRRPGTDILNTHKSETDLDDAIFDTEFYNLETLQDLYRKVDEFMTSIQEGGVKAC